MTQLAVEAKPDTIPCRTCNATGFEELPARHRGALRVLEEGGTMSATQVWKKLRERITATAVNNRLEDLRKWQYVGRRRDGRQWMYWATTIRPPRAPKGSCLRSPSDKHQLVTFMVGEMRIIECGVCHERSPDSD